MTRKRATYIIAALAVTVGMGLAVNEFASAQGYGFGPRRAAFGGHMGFGGGPLISQALALKDELKLNENQVQKLEQLRTAFYEKAAKERIEMQAIGLEMQKLYLQDKVDVAAAEKQIRALEKKRADLRIERLKAIEEAKTVLTAEQLKQLQTYGFGPRFGRGGFGPGFGRGGHMGPGGGGWGMGPGSGMMGPGYGPGSHMGQGWGGGQGWGPGSHMGYGRGWGMGPGWGSGTPQTQQQ